MRHVVLVGLLTVVVSPAAAAGPPKTREIANAGLQLTVPAGRCRLGFGNSLLARDPQRLSWFHRNRDPHWHAREGCRPPRPWAGADLRRRTITRIFPWATCTDRHSSQSTGTGLFTSTWLRSPFDAPFRFEELAPHPRGRHTWKLIVFTPRTRFSQNARASHRRHGQPASYGTVLAAVTADSCCAWAPRGQSPGRPRTRPADFQSLGDAGVQRIAGPATVLSRRALVSRVDLARRG